MPETTEIYLCKAGQALNEGRIEYSQSVTTRAAAEADAAARCARDGSLVKIAYYSVGVDGDFRVIYTHNNLAASGPDAAKPVKKRARSGKRKKPPKRSFWRRLFGG